MLSRNYYFATLVVLFTSTSAIAQNPQITLQLPTFNFTTVGTTVNVPDGGSAMLGGIDRVREGSNEVGMPILGQVPYLNRLFKNRAIGRDVSSSRFRAHAKILILEELEQEVMDQASSARAARGDRRSFEEMAADYQAREVVRQHEAQRRQAGYLSRNVDRQPLQLTRAVPEEPEQPEIPNLDQIRRQNELARQQRDAEAVAYFEKAQAAQQAGKKGSARVYYNMAVRRAKGDFKQEILTQLELLTGNATK